MNQPRFSYGFYSDTERDNEIAFEFLEDKALALTQSNTDKKLKIAYQICDATLMAYRIVMPRKFFQVTRPQMLKYVVKLMKRKLIRLQKKQQSPLEVSLMIMMGNDKFWWICLVGSFYYYLRHNNSFSSTLNHKPEKDSFIKLEKTDLTKITQFKGEPENNDQFIFMSQDLANTINLIKLEKLLSIKKIGNLDDLAKNIVFEAKKRRKTGNYAVLIVQVIRKEIIESEIIIS